MVTLPWVGRRIDREYVAAIPAERIVSCQASYKRRILRGIDRVVRGNRQVINRGNINADRRRGGIPVRI